MEPNEVTQKKKRGRKPKKKKEDTIPETTNPIDTEENNMVIRLSEPIKMNESHPLQEGGDLKPYAQNQDHCDYGGRRTGDVCWNCCHEFTNTITGIPMKYLGGIYYTYGDFCSLECSSRYAYEYFPNDFWEILSITNLYNREIYGEFIPIELAASKLVLKRFGGELNIDDYRNKKNIHDIQLPPILPINHYNNIYEKKIKNNLDNLKLYRKHKLPSEKKSITNSMKMIISQPSS